MGGIFRFILSGPATPAPPPPRPAAPSAKADTAVADGDAEAARRSRLRAQGRSANIVTGGLGDTTAANTAERTLLGRKRTLGQ